MSVSVLTLDISSQIAAIPSLYYSQQEPMYMMTQILLNGFPGDNLTAYMIQQNADYDWTTCEGIIIHETVPETRTIAVIDSNKERNVVRM